MIYASYKLPIKNILLYNFILLSVHSQQIGDGILSVFTKYISIIVRELTLVLIIHEYVSKNMHKNICLDNAEKVVFPVQKYGKYFVLVTLKFFSPFFRFR